MAANKQGIEAGKGFVTLGVDQNPLVAGLDKAAQRVKAWGGGLARIGASIAAAGAGMLTARRSKRWAKQRVRTL